MDDREAGEFRDGLCKSTPMTAQRVGFHTDEDARTLVDEYCDGAYRGQFGRQGRDFVRIEHHSAIPIGREEATNFRWDAEFSEVAILNAKTVQKSSQCALVEPVASSSRVVPNINQPFDSALDKKA